MERTILHINVIHFYVTVACIQAPRLTGYPVAVLAPGSRRILLDVSSKAWEAGVSRGMTFEAARRLCPDLITVDPTPALYNRIEKTLFNHACSLSPLVERAGPGHVFLDLTGTRRLFGDTANVADRIRNTIRDTCRMEPAVGIGSNMLVSKIATRVIKPTGVCTVIPGCEEEFMAPLPVTLLPGIETPLLDQLLQFNLHLIRDLTRIPPDVLASAIGPSAFSITNQARGIDQTPVRGSGQPAPSITEQITLAEQTNDDARIKTALFELAASAGNRVRAMGLAIGAIRLLLRYADGLTAVRRQLLRPPVSGDLSLYDRCCTALDKLLTRRVRLADLTLECFDLTFPYGQMDLFDNTEREEQLMSALDVIRKNHGRDAIRFWGRERVG